MIPLLSDRVERVNFPDSTIPRFHSGLDARGACVFWGQTPLFFSSCKSNGTYGTYEVTTGSRLKQKESCLAWPSFSRLPFSPFSLSLCLFPPPSTLIHSFGPTLLPSFLQPGAVCLPISLSLSITLSKESPFFLCFTLPT